MLIVLRRAVSHRKTTSTGRMVASRSWEIRPSHRALLPEHALSPEDRIRDRIPMIV